MGPTRGSREGGRPQDVPRPETRADGRYPPPPYVGPAEHRERADSYWTWLALGVLSPFLLAVPLYPLVWWPVGAVVLPLARLAWGALLAVLGLFGASPAGPAGPPPPAQPGGPMPWDVGPLLSPQVALCWALAFLAARFVLARVAGRSRGSYEESQAKRGFRAGLRGALLLAFLAAVWWLNRMLVTG